MANWSAVFANIGTLGYYGYSRSLRFEKQLAEKSLRDATGGDQYTTTAGTVAVIPARTSGDAITIFKKRNVRALRNYAEFSTWVRRAIDIACDAISQAQYQINKADPEKKQDKGVARELTALLARPNPAGQSYQQLKRMMAEDYFVIGHGAIEKLLKRSTEPYGLISMDAATLGFIPGWDGTNPRQPRYAEIQIATGRTTRLIANDQIMLMVNRPRSYDVLGLSHIEVLDLAIRGLLNGDDYLINQVLNPTPSGALNLGRGANQQQVDETRSQIEAVKRALIILGGTESAQYIPFNGSPKELQVLDTATWFARQVASVFGISTAQLALSVDTSRANTEALLGNSQEGLGAVLWEFQLAENQSIVDAFGPVEKHNCVLEYSIFSQKNMEQQAKVTSIQLSNTPWVTLNEARKDNGQTEIAMDIANEILIPTTTGPIPLSHLQRMYFEQPDLALLPLLPGATPPLTEQPAQTEAEQAAAA